MTLDAPWPPDVSLSGAHAALEPLSQTHAADLAAASADGALHRLWYTSIPAPEEVSAEIDRRLRLRAEGSMQPFAVIAPARGPKAVGEAVGEAVGMTTYMNIDATHRRLEIGSTWIARSVQRSPLNTECKLLLLDHAFETLDCIAVEFRTHFMNRQSRNAIERLGAKLDGVLRAHSVMANGTLRDTAVYSIIAAEWPAVKANLQARLAAAPG